MYLVLFIFFGGLCVAAALNLLLQRHPINSALSLIVVMSSLAVLYLLLGAEFLAAAQVIVYAGAIMVLFTFVVMLLNAGKEERTQQSWFACCHSSFFPPAPAWPRPGWETTWSRPATSARCSSAICCFPSR
jgi:NADH:ubiquinone oxidoreductase subunit 6 (subunit J)